MPRILSEPLPLNPGFTVDGAGKITGARVRLLTRTDRQTIQEAVAIKASSQIRDIQLAAKQVAVSSGQPPKAGELDSIVKTNMIFTIQEDEEFKQKIHSFILEDGTEIDAREKVETWIGLLTEPDEQELNYQMREQGRAHQRPHFRPKHTCASCGEPVDCVDEQG
jgi:hypothetical protein